MGRIHIVTDSTGELTKEEIEKYHIHIVPLTIQIDDQTYIDGVDIGPAEFLEKMANISELPKSSQPAVGVFKELFDELGSNGDEVLVITMTGGMSGTVKSAEAAAMMSDTKVVVVDSRFISYALGFQVLEAAKMAQEGKTMEEILKRVDHVRSNTNLLVVVDTLKNLIKGGRIGKGTGLVGSLLNIKPIASLEGGAYNPVAKVRSHKQVVKYLFKRFQEETHGKKVKGVGIAHANGLHMLEPLKALIEESGYHDVKFGYTSPIISTHTGAGAIGFSYYTD
ncbi:DegV family protein [Rummeliibacillus suwonensis]|uniref:DegV family protein n=1 Tax=Rummeliibacillus suwonensis TaxID=1306154 RepID=UPI0011B63DA4|nr:DegV family protein [Rummeliibacillus suwonensis]MBO2537041.1 DegV family protein [Rummeliibacillus suwonensis]